jgi:hypothetical protein
MYHILNNKLNSQYGGDSRESKGEFQKRSYLSAFSYILLIFVYSLESAGYLKGEEQFKKLKRDDGFFSIFIAFSVMIPLTMLIVVFAVNVKQGGQKWVNLFIWVFMALHLGLTLAAFIIADPKVTSDIKGFTYTKVVFIFIGMAIAIQSAKVHSKKTLNR